MHLKIAGTFTGPVTKWLVLVTWIAIAFFGFLFGSKLIDEQSNDIEAWLPETAESTVGLDRLSDVQDLDQFPTVVVYERPGEDLTEADLAAIAEDTTEFAQLDGVVADDPATRTQGILGPLTSDPADGGVVAHTTITFDLGDDGWDGLPALADDIRDIADHDGLTTYVTGAGGQGADQAEAFEGLDTTLLLVALLVVIVLLLLAYRSPVLWLLPVITALTALFTAQGVVYGLVKTIGITVNGQSYAILSILVIGASVDYALLLVARYREELRRHEDRHEAMAFALHRASPAIIASGLTVALGMLCLTFADMSSTAGIGPIAAAGVATGVAAMLTLLPALLVIFGRWVFWPLRPGFGSHEPTSDGFWAGIGDRISRAPRLVWIGTAAVLAIAALATLRMDTSGLPTEESYTKEMESVVGAQLLADRGVFDESTPVQVVTAPGHGAEVAAVMADVDGLGQPSDPIPLGTDPAAPMLELVEAPVESADPIAPDAFDTIRDLRETIAERAPDADASVTGNSALFLDITEASARDNVVIMPLVLLVVLLVLIGLLRCLFAPLILMATVVLSFGAALGLSWLIFEFVLGHGGMNAGTPLFVFVFLVALGIDYNIFLMTRVREETATHGTREASRIALAATGGVITSAGLVLAGTFSVLLTMPLVDFVQIGLAIALGIILDTFIVRSVLVTALNLDLGSRIWWPSRLDRGSSAPDRDPDAERALV